MPLVLVPAAVAFGKIAGVKDFGLLTPDSMNVADRLIHFESGPAPIKKAAKRFQNCACVSRPPRKSAMN